MKITPELLQKYSLDDCTPGEKYAVENWLLNAGEELPELTTHHLQKAEDIVWDKLSVDIFAEDNTVRDLRPAYALYRFAAAACLLVTVGLGWYLAGDVGIGNEHARFTNENGISPKNVQVGQLALTLLPNSLAESSVSLTGNTEINFIGNVEFTNHSNREVQLTVNYLTKRSRYTTKIVECKPGKRYVAMYSDYKVGEIFVVAWDDLRVLPPMMVRRALKEFRV